MKTIVHFYRFSTEIAAEAQAWSELYDKLTGMGLRMSESVSPYTFNKEWDDFWARVKNTDNKEIELETEHLFDNQWNSAPMDGEKNGMRLFDWAQVLFPNDRIKQGYWLEQTNEMADIRTDTCQCGYCKKQYYKPTQKFCDDCLGSQYLKENQLYQLELRPVKDGDARWKEIDIPKSMLHNYRVMQRAGRSRRLADHERFCIEQDTKKMLQRMQVWEFVQWMIDHDEDVQDNTIMYKDGEITIGWRNTLTMEEAERIQKKMDDNGYKKFIVHYITR